MDNRVINPHDSFFRETFGRREIAVNFLREYLPARIIARLDLDSLSLVKDSFVDKELRHHYSDLLYSVQHKKGKMYIYFLFEHKSSPDIWTPLQLLRYSIRIWEMLRKQYPRKKKLPAIIPLVLYHGRRKWHIATSFRPLVEPADKVFDSFIPDFTYQLVDLSALSDDQVKGDVLERIVMLLLKHIFDPNLRDRLPGILSLFQEVEARKDTLDILEVLLRYMVKATQKFDEHDLREVLEESFIKEDIMQDFIDRYFEQGM